MEKYLMPCEKIVLRVDMNIDVAKTLAEELSPNTEEKLSLYPDPISCLRENLGLRVGILSHNNSFENIDGVICSRKMAIALRAVPKFDHLLVACYTNITCNHHNGAASFAKLSAQGVDCFIVRTPAVDSFADIIGLKGFYYVIENEVNPNSNGKKYFWEKLGLLPKPLV